MSHPAPATDPVERQPEPQPERQPERHAGPPTDPQPELHPDTGSHHDAGDHHTAGPAAGASAGREVGRAVGLAVVLAVAILTVFTCFALPGVKSAPHEIPVGVAVPAPIAERVEQGLSTAQPGAFAVTRYADAAALRDAVGRRESYGGLAMGPDGRPTMYVASGASPTVAQLLTQVAQRLGERLPAANPASGAPSNRASTGTNSSTNLAVVDLAPLTSDDPRGAGLAGAAFPIALGGVLPAVALSALAGRRTTRRGDRGGRTTPGAAAGQVVGGLTVATLVGVGVAAILQRWFGSVPGDASFWPIAGGLALGLGAITFGLLGLGALAGRVGLALGAVVVLLLGNPLSGLTSAPELLPAGWGALGQALPPGANGTLLRSTAFFGGAGGGRPALILAAYLVGGLVLIGLGVLAGRRRQTADSVR